MRFELHVDGSMEFQGKFPLIRLTHYDVKDNVATPKYPCEHRQGRCSMSPCGKRPVFRWRCNHFNKAVGLNDCEGCNVRQQGQGHSPQ